MPTEYRLVIKLTTAKALGLDVPEQPQQRADEVTARCLLLAVLDKLRRRASVLTVNGGSRSAAVDCRGDAFYPKRSFAGC
jgi:hypothetical protein